MMANAAVIVSSGQRLGRAGAGGRGAVGAGLGGLGGPPELAGRHGTDD
jgi:hypothetical protein